MDASLAHSGFGCPLCFASYTSEGPRMPLILHCGHSSCQQCVDLFQTSSVSENSLCPLCMVEGTQTPFKELCPHRDYGSVGLRPHFRKVFSLF